MKIDEILTTFYRTVGSLRHPDVKRWFFVSTFNVFYYASYTGGSSLSSESQVYVVEIDQWANGVKTTNGCFPMKIYSI